MTHPIPHHRLEIPERLLRQFTDEEKRELDALLETAEYAGAREFLQNRIVKDPMNPHLFKLLGDVYEADGKLGESIVAYDRALYLREKAAKYEPSPMAWTLKDMRLFVDEEKPRFELDNLEFARLLFIGEGKDQRLVGRSRRGEFFIQLNLNEKPETICRWENEAAILRHLTEKGCHSSPKFHSAGRIPFGKVKEVIENSDLLGREITDETLLHYLISGFVEKQPIPSFGDIALTLLEQKALGVYIGAVSEDKLRFNSQAAICFLVGYKDGIFLEKEQMEMSPKQFFEWAHDRELAGKLSQNSRSLLYGGRERIPHEDQFWGIFKDQALDLRHCRAFIDQQTTGSKSRILHSLDEKSIYIQGDQQIKEEDKRWLDTFFPIGEGQKVLDVGCAGGMQAFYIQRKGYLVTGIDIDSQLINGNQLVATIVGLDVEFKEVDIDFDEIEEDFDTVCLFGVWNWLRRRESTAEKIQRIATRRILISAGLSENGYFWGGNWFQLQEGWNYPTLEGLKEYFKAFFDQFELMDGPEIQFGSKYLFQFLRVK